MSPLLITSPSRHLLPFQLPVHVNAYWELSSNRRDIWRGDDTTGNAKIRSDWNMHVMRDVLAPLYAILLAHTCAHLDDTTGTLSLTDRGTRSTLDSTSTLATLPALPPSVSMSPYSILSLFPCPLPPEPWRVLSQVTLLPLPDAHYINSS